MSLREKLAAGHFITAPGVFDHLSLLLANRIGFDAVYASGFWNVASDLGLPDAGLATYTDFINRFTGLAQASAAPVIADADTGFGGLINIAHTLKGYERAGISAIQIEDQEFPKKCGHTPHRRVIPTARMCTHIKVAVEARNSEDFLVIARTDARTGYGLDEAIERMHAYAEAGADILFLESLQSAEEMATFCSAVNKPCMANMSNGGYTPVLTVTQLRELGYAMAIFPALAPLAALAAMEQSYLQLKQSGDGNPAGVALYDFRQLCSEIGFDDIDAFEARWGRFDEPQR